jgi:hypothetical protein
MAYECETCNRDFVNWHAACQHMNAVGHWSCEVCDAEFWTQDAADDHMGRYGHFRPQFDCEACNASFNSKGDARQHLDAKNHWRQHWCQSCKRGFENQNNLNMVSFTNRAACTGS